MDIPFKYDVAFSFLAIDEAIAVQLNDLLQDRYATFLYSERQRDIAGTDGAETFTKVFAEEARLVVVLYREGWGDSRWTRIEQTAIKNRAFDQGYDYALFLPLNKPPSIPKWLPKTQLWIGLERWGLSGAASVIDARIQQLGGSLKTETVEDKASRIKRELDWDRERKKTLSSTAGVKSAESECQILQSLFGALIEQIQKKDDLGLRFETKGFSSFVHGKPVSLAVYWNNHFCNTLESARLVAVIWQGGIPMPDVFFPFEEPTRLEELEFTYNLDRQNQAIWSDSRKGDYYLSDRLVEMLFEKYLVQLRSNRLG